MALLATLAPVGYRGLVSSTGDGTADAPATAATEGAKRAFYQLPLAFEPNHGQTDEQVDFVSRGAGQTLFLTPNEAVFSLAPPKGSAVGGEATVPPVVRMQLLDANPAATPRTHEPTDAKVSYFLGEDKERWRTGVPTFGKVSYSDVYPGVDLVYYGTQSQLEYDFSVAPGIDPGVIAFRVVGGESVRLDAKGDLVVSTPVGELRQAKPVIYQEIDGARRPVDGEFVLRGDREVAFRIGAYDTTRRLVIDPVLDYSTFLGGTANDFGFGIAVDSSGNVYVGGQTGSATFPRGGTACPAVAPFPATCDPAPRGASGGYDTTINGATDAFALKFNPAGTTNNTFPDGSTSASTGALVWAAYVGGSANDAGYDLALDASNNVYLAGSTQSSGFPTTANAFDTTCGTDGLCNVIQSPPGTPIPGAPVPADAFVSRISASGTALDYSSFLGGSAEEQAADEVPYSAFLGLAVRGTSAYVTSLTFSSDFPVKGNAPQSSCASCSAGLSDSFLSVVNTSASGASSLSFSTFLGGKATDEGKGVAVDATGNVYLTGHTFGNAENSQGNPVDNTFPVKNALQETYRGGYSDAYVAKINPAAKTKGMALVYSTFLGGGGLEEGWDIALKPGGTEAYVTGYTTSGPNPHPQTEDPGHPGACLQTPDADGVRPFCDYATDPAPYFPTTTGPAYAGRASTDSGSTLFTNGDAFLVKLSSAGNSLAWSRFIGGPSSDYGQGVVVGADGKAYVAGWTTCRSQDPLLEPGDEGFNPTRDEAPPQFYIGNPEITDGTPTGRNPGEPAETGVADCPSAANGYDVSGTFLFGAAPNLNAGEPAPAAGLMDGNNFDNHFNDNPTGIFLVKVSADGSALDYAVLLDGFGFDRGFDVALRETGGQPEAYVTGRVGSCSTSTQIVDGHPVAFRTCTDGAPYPTTSGAFDTSYNGGGRDTIISKVVG